MVYLIHFSSPYRHARHYLGSVEGGKRAVANRLARHLAGNGARLMAVIAAAGIGAEIVRTWPGGRREERKLKRRKCGCRLCPKCNPRRQGGGS